MFYGKVQRSYVHPARTAVSNNHAVPTFSCYYSQCIFNDSAAYEFLIHILSFFFALMSLNIKMILSTSYKIHVTNLYIIYLYLFFLFYYERKQTKFLVLCLTETRKHTIVRNSLCSRVYSDAIIQRELSPPICLQKYMCVCTHSVSSIL